MKNVQKKMGDDLLGYKRESGQMTLDISPKSDENTLIHILTKIPGIASFSFAKKVSSEIESLKKECINLIQNTEFTTFKVLTKRQDKSYPIPSMEVSALLGAAILENTADKKVRMNNMDLLLTIEITENRAYISTKKRTGISGLPTQPNQKIVALLSGGIDSPVAAYSLMKRGAEVILVHFQNQSQETISTENKIRDLASHLSHYQIRTQLFIVPFEKIQKEIIIHIPAKIRMLVYKKIMLHIASKIAQKHNALFLTVGDNFSQVASQTYENLFALYLSTPLPVFSPLIGLNKKEIIDTAKKIGTYDISIQKAADCCSYFIPKHPELRANPELLQKWIDQISLEKLTKQAIEEMKERVWE